MDIKEYEGKVVNVLSDKFGYKKGIVFQGAFYNVGWVSPDGREKFDGFVLHKFRETEFERVDEVMLSSPLETAVLKALQQESGMVSIPIRIE